MFGAQIESDSLTKTARENWAAEEPAAYSAELVAKIYAAELNGGKPQPPKLRRIMLLEISQYLENYLIPHFSQVWKLLSVDALAGNRGFSSSPRQLFNDA